MMPPLYIGGGGGNNPTANPILYGGGSVSTGGRQFPKSPILGGRPPIFGGGPISPPGGPGTYSGLPAQRTVPAPTTPSNTIGPQAVRPTGPSQGYDPAYLQNLATAVGGLFSRPNGGLSFNPLGNLSDIGGPGLGGGNAPLPGLPNTLLQDALNGLAFIFNQPAATAPTSGGPTTGGGGGGYNGGRNRGGRPIYSQ